MKAIRQEVSIKSEEKKVKLKSLMFLGKAGNSWTFHFIGTRLLLRKKSTLDRMGIGGRTSVLPPILFYYRMVDNNLNNQTSETGE